MNKKQLLLAASLTAALPAPVSYSAFAKDTPLEAGLKDDKVAYGTLSKD